MVDANELELAGGQCQGRDAQRRRDLVTAENVTVARSDASGDIAGEFVALRFTGIGKAVAMTAGPYELPIDSRP